MQSLSIKQSEADDDDNEDDPEKDGSVTEGKCADECTSVLIQLCKVQSWEEANAMH